MVPKQDVLDVTSETMTRAYERWSRISRGGQGAIRGWVGAAARNVAFEHLRRRGREGDAADDARPVLAMSHPFDEHVVNRLPVAKCLDGLTKLQREAWTLTQLADMTQVEAAAALNRSRDQIRESVDGARGALQRCLQREGFELRD